MKKWLFLIVVIILLISCSGVDVTPTNYYILRYNHAFENDYYKSSTPFNSKVVVLDSNIQKTYSRNQIVSRNSPYKITYLSNYIWASKLSSSVPDIINTKLVRYNVFTQVSRDLITDANYVLETNINSFEYLQLGDTNAAHLNIEFILKNAQTNEIVARYLTDRQKSMDQDDLELFVQYMNELLMEESDTFVSIISEAINSNQMVSVINDRNFNKQENSQQKNSEMKVDLISKGRLYFPVKTEPELEPSISILDENNEYVGNYYMGRDIHLTPGNYIARFGSGSANQKLKKEFLIKEGYKTVVHPDWSWLVVYIMDENRNSRDDRYELFDLETSESYGTKTGVNDEVGEKVETWILKPGEYKITLKGEPFNTYENFTTVTLEEGKLTEYTIVVDSDTGSLIGAGTLDINESTLSHDWKISSAIHTNATLESDNEDKKGQQKTSINLQTQLDNRIIYEKYPHHFVMKNLYDVSLSKEPDSDFRISKDDFDLKNTYVYYFYDFIGLYLRGDLNTHFFNEYIYTADKQNYLFVDSENDSTYYYNQDNVKIKPYFSPSEFKEGIGVNLRIFNTYKAKLSLRAGFGLQQIINSNVYSYLKDETINNVSYKVYKENENISNEGVELSLDSNFQLPYDITFTSNFDALFPFDKNSSENYEWENIVNFKLIKFVSLDYKLNLGYNKDTKDYPVVDHSLYLRLTYLIY